MTDSDMAQIKPIAHALEASGLPKKPRFGSACNNCGLCCSVAQCEVSKLAFGPGAIPCPALTKADGKATCSFVTTELEHNLEPTIQLAIGVGCGCSMPDRYTTDLDKLRFDQHSLIYAIKTYNYKPHEQ